MKKLSSVAENSFLRNDDDALKNFSWDAVSNDLLNKMTLDVTSYIIDSVSRKIKAFNLHAGITNTKV